MRKKLINPWASLTIASKVSREMVKYSRGRNWEARPLLRISLPETSAATVVAKTIQDNPRVQLRRFRYLTATMVVTTEAYAMAESPLVSNRMLAKEAVAYLLIGTAGKL